jgi:hypothetical protein
MPTEIEKEISEGILKNLFMALQFFETGENLHPLQPYLLYWELLEETRPQSKNSGEYRFWRRIFRILAAGGLPSLHPHHPIRIKRVNCTPREEFGAPRLNYHYPHILATLHCVKNWHELLCRLSFFSSIYSSL